MTTSFEFLLAIYNNAGYRKLIPCTFKDDLLENHLIPNVDPHRWMSKPPYDTLISSRSRCGEFEVNPREEFVLEVFVASIFPLPSPFHPSGNHKPSERVTWTQRCSLEYS